MSLRNLTIGQRLGVAFGLLVLVMFVLSAVSLRGLGNLHHAEKDITHSKLPTLEAIAGVNLSLMRFRIFTLRAALTSSEAELNQIQVRIQAIKSDVENARRTYELLISSAEERQLFSDLTVTVNNYFEGSALVVGAMQRGSREEAKAILESQLNPLADKMTQMLLGLNQLNSRAVTAVTEQSEMTFARNREFLLATMLIALGLTIALAWLVVRSIVHPIAQAVAATETVASGDLTQQIAIEGKDEPARLLLALSAMQQTLRTALGEIADSAAQLATATEELHAVAEDASRTLQNQNSEIQQAASAVTEMSAAVDEVARNAVTTAEASNQSAQLAHEGRNMVQQTIVSIETMTAEVAKTSQQIEVLAAESKDISKVLEVIRGIAEQTNLLALNAAIEAARAGEAGRGFAVVADEVRALAHRTQASTREIETMVSKVLVGTQAAVTAMSENAEQAEKSLRDASQAGGALDAIYTQVGRISERNLLIASASEEQAAVAREVDRNIVNISDYSSQSAAGANQTSASAQELARLAVGMKNLVGQFRI